MRAVRPVGLSPLPSSLPLSTQELQQLLSTAQIPRVDRVDRGLAHEPLNLRKTVPLQLQCEQLPATFSELSDGCQQSVHPLLLIQLLRRVVAGVGKRKVLHRFLIILAVSEGLAMGIQHLEPQNLK